MFYKLRALLLASLLAFSNVPPCKAEGSHSFLIRDLLVCPIGWDSEVEVEQAIAHIGNSLIETILSINTRSTLRAPIDGELAKEEDKLILTSRQYRIIYPITGEMISTDLRNVTRDESIIELKEPEVFILFLRKPGSLFSPRRIPAQGVRIVPKQPMKVFSANSGIIYYARLDEETTETEAVIATPSLSNKQYGTGMMGVGEYLYVRGSKVRLGQQIGATGLGGNQRKFTFHLLAEQSEEPLAIYLEVL